MGQTFKDNFADKAVDGDANTDAHGFFWWGVDLGKPFLLTGIRITFLSLGKFWYYFKLVIMFHKHV